MDMFWQIFIKNDAVAAQKVYVGLWFFEIDFNFCFFLRIS